MLQVISAGSTALCQTRGSDSVLLNCWDKSSPLIKELEQTVNFAEKKCGDLMQQLHFYKEYYKKWAKNDRVSETYYKNKFKKCGSVQSAESGSENEFEKVNHYFSKKIRNKINEMNEEITQANRLISIQKECSPPVRDIALTPPVTRDEPSEPNNSKPKPPESKTCKSEPVVTITKETPHEPENTSQPHKFIVKVTEKQSSKSVPGRSKIVRKRDVETAKRRYSSLQRFKIRSKSLPQGVRRKFGFGGFIEVFDPETKCLEKTKTYSKTSLKSSSYKIHKKGEGKSKTKLSESNGDFTHKSSRKKPRSARSFHRELPKLKPNTRPETYGGRNSFSKETKYEFPTKRDRVCRVKSSGHQIETNPCKAIVPVEGKCETIDFEAKSNISLQPNLSQLIAKPNALVPFMRNPIPFIPCSSTSKTFNLGLNIQQVLSLIKSKKHSVMLQTVVRNGMQAARMITEKAEPTVNTLYISQMATTHGHLSSMACPAREGSEDGFTVISRSRSKCSILKQIQTPKPNKEGVEEDVEPKISRIEIKEVGRPEDVWVVDQPDATGRAFKKVKSKCTCFPSKHCVDYHKVLRQYTGWRLYEHKADTFETTSNGRLACGSIMTCNKSKFCDNVDVQDGRVQLMKVHDDLINLNRKYLSLEEQVSQNSVDDFEANAELDAMESELAVKEVEFKDVMSFYNQLLQLKENIKSLRRRCRQMGVQQDKRPKKDPLRPTPSMALTRVLRKIQGLQDKIKLMDAP